MAQCFNKPLLEAFARKSGFIKRKSKLSAFEFLNILMFTHHQGKLLSLLDLTGDLYEQFGIRLAKQSLQERFNHYAVEFMKLVLSHTLNQQLTPISQKEQLSEFNRIRIKDSTRFALPEQYASTYQGHGGATHNSKSMISIQYEYDLLTGQTMDFRLTNGRCNDQLDSREHTYDIVENDLFIRDLGYSTMGYLKKIINNKAYFLNRLSPQTVVYHADNHSEAVNFKKCIKKIKKHNLPYLEYDVLAGKQAQIPCRLVISPVDNSTYEKRLRKTQKQARSYGHQVSDRFKARAHLNLFITNVSRKWMPAEKAKSIYGLRWQIELIFKIWKSQAKINEIKEMKIHRFECQLIGKIIWLLINWKIFCWVVKWINKNHPGESCSVWKYYKCAFRLSSQLREAIIKPAKARSMINLLTQIAKKQFLLEIKKGKPSHYQAFKLLA